MELYSGTGPLHGGFYERLAGTVKGALKKSICKICLTEKKLETFLTEAEAVNNSRPLVQVGEDFGSGFSLTPADVLNLSAKSGVPIIEINNPHDPYYGNKSSTDKLLEIWGKGQQHLNSLWRVWIDDYSLNLRERGQTHVKGPRIQAVLPRSRLPTSTYNESLLLCVREAGEEQH